MTDRQRANYRALWARKLGTQDPAAQYGSNLRWDYGLRELKNPTAVLDIGCGDGKFLGLLRKQHPACRFLGVDASEEAVAFARLRLVESEAVDLRVVDMDCEPLPFETGSIPAATCLDVIEHIADPPFLMAEACRVLAPGGLLLLTTANYRFWKHLVTLAVGGRIPVCTTDTEAWRGGHFHFFTWADMEDMLRKAGFGHIIYDRWGPFQPPPPEWARLIRLPAKAPEVGQTELYIRARK